MGSVPAALCLLMVFALALETRGCDETRAQGDMAVISLRANYSEGDHLTWKLGSNVVWETKKDENPDDGDRVSVSKRGSLKLDDVQKSDEGIYTPELRRANGRTEHPTPQKLCVTDPKEPEPKPKPEPPPRPRETPARNVRPAPSAAAIATAGLSGHVVPLLLSLWLPL